MRLRCLPALPALLLGAAVHARDAALLGRQAGRDILGQPDDVQALAQRNSSLIVCNSSFDAFNSSVAASERSRVSCS
jgi:hypothetical protein